MRQSSIASLGVCATCLSASAQPSLLILGENGPDTTHTYATAVSADGQVIAGFSIQQQGIRAFRWTASTGVVLLDAATPDPNEQGTPFALSADGAVVVGFRAIAGFPVGVAWDSAGAVTELGTLGLDPDSNLNYSSVNACTPAADVLVGITSSPQGQEAFRWTKQDGLVGLGGLSDTPPFRSDAFGVGSDGNTIVGDSLNSENKTRLFRWDSILGMQALSSGGFDELSVNDASPDARAMTGGARTGPDQAASPFVWHESTGVTPIPMPSGAATAFGFAVNNDGHRVTGRYEPADTPPGTSGFIWTPDSGSVDLNAYCIDTLGIDPGDWILYPEDTDASGGVVVGAARLHTNGSQFALAEAAFVLDLGLPCSADLTADGNTNFFDLIEFLDRYTNADPRADLDENGLFNFFDVSAYLGEFSACS